MVCKCIKFSQTVNLISRTIMLHSMSVTNYTVTPKHDPLSNIAEAKQEV
jgi:hypothetical protein